MSQKQELIKAIKQVKQEVMNSAIESDRLQAYLRLVSLECALAALVVSEEEEAA